MAGLLAIKAFERLWNVLGFAKYGALALEHRGGNRVVACVHVKDKLACGKFSDTEGIGSLQPSTAAIVGLYSDESDSESCFVETSARGVDVALLADRRHRGLEEIAMLLADGSRSGTLKEVITQLEDMEPPSFIALTGRGDVIAARDSLGLSALILGSYGFDMAIVSSESAAVEVIGADVKKVLKPGEAVYASNTIFKVAKPERPHGCRLCAFELLYLARHDSFIDNVSVYVFRKRLGFRMAWGFDKEVDVVVGVPETALPYAIGFSQRLGKPFELAFVQTGVRRRSMLKTDPLDKMIAIHLKMNPIRSVLEGKKIALVDDSMVTGSTMKSAVQQLRFGVGVKEIHLAVASPPLVSTCPYSLFKLDPSRLLAVNLAKEEAARYLDVDSLSWVGEDVLEDVVREFRIVLCGICFGKNAFGEIG